MKNYLAKVTNFWDEDRSLTAMLLLLLLFIFIFVPAFGHSRGDQILIKAIYSVILLTGILSVAKNKTQVTIVSVLALLGLLANWFSDIEPSVPALIAHDFGAIIYILVFAIAILIKTFQKGDVTYHRIEGSVVVYLLMGLIFGFGFDAIYLYFGPSTFNNIHEAGLKDFLYFSFTSLSTMGYGDITPVHPFARSIANLEALIGQLYPAILIARLVSMEFESSLRKKEKKELTDSKR